MRCGASKRVQPLFILQPAHVKSTVICLVIAVASLNNRYGDRKSSPNQKRFNQRMLLKGYMQKGIFQDTPPIYPQRAAARRRYFNHYSSMAISCFNWKEPTAPLFVSTAATFAPLFAKKIPNLDLSKYKIQQYQMQLNLIKINQIYLYFSSV